MQIALLQPSGIGGALTYEILAQVPANTGIAIIESIGAVVGVIGCKLFESHFYSPDKLTIDEKTIRKLNTFHQKIASRNLAGPLVMFPVLIGGVCVASRLAAGGIGLMAKGVSWLTRQYDQDDLAQKIDNAKDQLFAFATRSIKSDLQITVGLSFLTTMSIAVPILLEDYPTFADDTLPYHWSHVLNAH